MWLYESGYKINIGTKSNTIGCHIIAFTVNHPSRIHYQRNTNQDYVTQTMISFIEERGHLEIFNPNYTECGKLLKMRMVSQIAQQILIHQGNNEGLSTHGFAAEDHLRDYLAKHLEEIELDYNSMWMMMVKWVLNIKHL